MAPSPRLISILFLLTISSMQIHARESQFFSKVSSATTTPTTTTINTNNNAQDKTLPSKEEQGLNKQELDPAFIPDTQNGYGLYGKESTQFPTTTKLVNSPYTATTYQPYKTQTQTQETYTNYPTDSTPNTNTNTNYYNNNQYSNNNQYKNNGYEEHQQNYGETSLQESEYTNMGNQNNNKYYNGANGYKNEEKQGMSDTRYLGNGQFYFDLKKENSNYYPNQYHQSSRNNYNTRGYYNNNNENSNYEYNNNSMQKYDNQNDFEESQEEQYDP